MVTVLLLASERSCTTAVSVKGQTLLQDSATQAATPTTATAMMKRIVLPRGGDDFCLVLSGLWDGAVALLRPDDMNLGLRNACEMLEV
jgi:hypothetical protein